MLKRFIFLAIFISLPACGFKAVYNDSKTAQQYEEDLASIRIKKNRTQIDQTIKNHLYDLLNPRLLDSEAKYILLLETKVSTSSTYTTDTGASGRNKVNLQINYTLKDLETAQTIGSGSTLVNDNYDITENRFGTYSADQYVTTNLTQIAAQNIRNSLVNDIIEKNKAEE